MKDVAKVGIRIFSIYLFIKFIASVGSAINYYGSVINSGVGVAVEVVVSIVLMIGLYLVFGLVLWKFNDSIAGLVSEGTNDANFKIDLDYNAMMRISLKMLGLVLIIGSIESAITEIIKIVGLNLDVFELKDRFYFLVSFAIPFIKIAIGITFITSKKVVNKFVKV